MPFDKTFVDPDTGEHRRAYVSHFVVKDGRLLEIHNVKTDATPEALAAATAELDNFVALIRLVQESGQADRYGLHSDEGGGQFIEFSDIDLDALVKVRVGPRESGALGFDRELEYTAEEIAEVAEEILRRQLAQKSGGDEE
jgi:hypothetical protein